MPRDASRLQTHRDRFEAALLDRLPDVQINGRAAPRLPQTANVTFGDIEAARLLLALRDLAVSTGSASISGSNKPSHVLSAMGLPAEDALATIRFSLGRFTTADEIDYAIAHVVASVEQLRREAATVGA